jgi:hypothetical protein
VRPWLRTSSVTVPHRFLAWVPAVETTLVASSRAVEAMFLPAPTAVSFTAPASPMATSFVELELLVDSS